MYITFILVTQEAEKLGAKHRHIFEGAARRAGPSYMSILCVYVCVSVCGEIISWPLISRNSETSRDVARGRTMQLDYF